MIVTSALDAQSIFVGEYNNRAHNISTEGGIASSKLTVHNKCTCRIQAHVIAPAYDDFFYMNISGATTQKTDHASGWVISNNIEPGSDWR